MIRFFKTVTKLTNKFVQENIFVEIYNQAIGGQSSYVAANKIQDYLKTNADIVFIFIGANDVFTLINANETNKNIRFIIEELNKQKQRHFIVTNLKFPIGLSNFSKKQDFVQAMEPIVYEIAKDYPNVTVVDDYFKNIPESELTPDGFHVKETSQNIIVETMYPIFKNVILNYEKD